MNWDTKIAHDELNKMKELATFEDGECQQVANDMLSLVQAS